MPLAGSLTTLAAVKQWLAINNLSDSDITDDILRRLIKAASQFALNYMQRSSIGRTEISEVADGYGNSFMMLKDWPVLDITSLKFGNGYVVPAASGDPLRNGYFLNPIENQTTPQRLTLFGSVFPRARSSVFLEYTAGYFIEAEPHTVPAMADYEVATDYLWFEDFLVTLEDGTPLTYVKTTPAALQYTIDPDSGVYTFNAAQAGADILISYSYVPYDISQAVCEMVGERFRYKDRIGINSKSLGGQETVSYANYSMSNYVRELLQPYKRVI